MYGWLNEALQGSSQVVTANRRLAKVLADHFAAQQVSAGRKAWRSPAIQSWQDWLQALFASAEFTRPLPVRLTTHQARVLWERCLGHRIANPLLNTSALVRQSRDAWNRIHDYGVPLEVAADAAEGRDQRLFAAAAFEYAATLEREGWIDDAMLPAFVTQLVGEGHAAAGERIVFAGFDRVTPAGERLHDALRAAGSECVVVAPPSRRQKGDAVAFENSDAELRGAGAWARQAVLENPGQAVAIVVAQLEKDAERAARLVREGFVPGWQAAGDARDTAVNVSYGQRLAAYPVIAVALQLLRWLHVDIGSQDVSRLLRSMCVGDGGLGGRSRLDLALRRLPVMTWSPERYLHAFKGPEPDATTTDWFERVRIVSVLRASLPGEQAPSRWALFIDEALMQLNWPGTPALDSVEFQLVNRWRELLNDLARIELVAPSMSYADALHRLQTLAGETVFQPESEHAVVQLLGPLEAAGMEFDRLWVGGLSAASWPPAGRPSPLVSRQVQRDYGMPDAEPADTLAYAGRVLQRLAASAATLRCSYPMTDGDAEQSPSGLLDDIAVAAAERPVDPGWYAATLVDCVGMVSLHDEPVPVVTADERVTGGAATLQRQLNDPFSAFAHGRLGVRPVPPLANGIPANVRGNLVHGALHALYREHPARADIAGWNRADVDARLPAILASAFTALERRADSTLKRLLLLEKRRVADLVHAVVALDAARGDFEIAALEASLEFAVDPLRLGLRLDRIDRLGSGELVILDYKTGRHRKFVTASVTPDDLQLVVYACAVSEPVAGLGFVNVDSRQVDLSGAGREFTPDIDWDEALAEWQTQVVDAAHALQRGDVRLNGALPIRDGRTFGLLSRIRELQQHG